MEVLWDVAASPSITADERARLLAKLSNRIDGNGVLRVVSEQERSQLRNRQLATARLRELVEEALHIPKPRLPTKPRAGAREDRLKEKKIRGETKKRRQKPELDD